MEEKSFLYSVNPKRVITGLSGVGSIRTAKSLYLTKEDVLVCLKKASVYRRFKDANERVTIANIDRLHRAEHLTEEEWEKVKVEEKSEGHGKVVVDEQEEESKQEASAEVADLTPASEEETTEAVENALVEDKEAVEVSDQVAVEAVDEEVQAETEEIEEESDSTEEAADEQEEAVQNTVYNGNNNKKKKNRNNNR